MKKFYFIVAVTTFSLALYQNAYTQISRQAAINYVVDSIVGNQIDSVNIYIEPDLLNTSYYNLGTYDSVYSPYSNWWLFFIDDSPYVLDWEHDCRYVIIDSLTGNHVRYDHSIPPFDYRYNLDTISITYQFQIPTVDQTKSQTSTTTDNEHLFAVLFGVDRCWHAFSHLYSSLREQGYPRDNIHVLFNDGDTANPNIVSLDLDNDGNYDIPNKLCTKENLEDIFENLEEEMGVDDLLFIYSNSHGVKGDTGQTKLLLWEYDTVCDYDMETMVQGIDYSELIYIVHSCNAGGFSDNFDEPHQTVICLVEWGIPYAGNSPTFDNTGMQPFDYGIFTALRGFHPKSIDEPWNKGEQIGEYDNLPSLIKTLDSTEVDFDPDEDGNNDKTYQIQEMIDYADFIDLQFPLFGVYNYNSGFVEDLLSPTGISGYVDTTQTVTGNYIIGDDLTLNDSIELTIEEGSKFFIVNGDLEFESESELILEDSLLFKNFQAQCSMNVYGDFSAGKVISFESNDSTTLTLRFENEDLEPDFSDCDFTNVSLYTYTDTATIDSGSVFTNSRIRGAEHMKIDSVTFDESSIILVAPGLSVSSAMVSNCDFSLAHPDENSLLSLYRFARYDISDNSFENYEESYGEGKHSVAIENSGTTGSSALHVIDGNTFTSDVSGYSNTNGIMIYSSYADINDNDIQDQRVGVMLTGTSQTELVGTSNFCNENTQVIKNNNQYQVYASENSFPTDFTWNVIYHDTLTKYFVLHDLVSQNYDSVDVSYNYWSYKHDPEDNLLPERHYNYEPIYEPCSKSVMVTGPADLYSTGVNYVDNGNYNSAKTTFKTIVEDYPRTEQASFAMKDIFHLEPLTDNNYASLQTWYLTEDSIVDNERLKKLGENLANKCDEKLGNFETAIDWYEDVIEDPPSLQDSIFAIIDLENCYFLMGIDTSLKSSYCGRMPQYKLSTVQAHLDHRDELLLLLLNSYKSGGIEDAELPEIENTVDKPGVLFQNNPNPFSGSTNIQYSISDNAGVEIELYNYNGQLIKTINEKTKTKGTHIIDFDASGLKNGIYFYSLKINGQTTDSKKMVILK